MDNLFSQSSERIGSPYSKELQRSISWEHRKNTCEIGTLIY